MIYFYLGTSPNTTVGHLCQYLEMVHSDVASDRRFDILVKHSPFDDPQVCSHGNRG